MNIRQFSRRIWGDRNGVAFQYNDTYNERIYSFVNNINTAEGGSH